MFIVHHHKNPRNTSEHYDVRFLNPLSNNTLYSFAFGVNFKDKHESKIAGIKTKLHDKRWFDLESYRMDVYDKGECEVLIHKPNSYFKLKLTGKKLNGIYNIFKLKNMNKRDYWLFVKPIAQQ